MAEALPGPSSETPLNQPSDPELIFINFSRTAE